MSENFPYYLMLSQLIRSLIDCKVTMDVPVYGLTSDSRQVKSGFVFVAYPGVHQDGRDYIEDAVKNGASAIMMESPTGKDDIQLRYIGDRTLPVLYVLNLQNLYGVFVSRFYLDPSRKVSLIGVTGTNGKSSVTQIFQSAMNRLHKKTGSIGTLGVSSCLDDEKTTVEKPVDGALQKTNVTHTTPDAADVQKAIANMQSNGYENIIMEVSSIGLDQNRVNGCIFDTAILTNISRDHLDYHETFEKYCEAKAKLFAKPFLNNVIVNIDDQSGKELFIRYSAEKNVIGYSLDKKYLDNRSVVVAHQVESGLDGSTFMIHSPWGIGEISTRLIGKFNIYNILACLASMCVHDVPFQDAIDSLAESQGVPGRMQRFKYSDFSPNIFVDYAHTPDALGKILSLLKQHCQGELKVVFGCGGDRDKGKRMLMGQVADKYADFVMLTDDNPRFENPDGIIEDIISGLSANAVYEIEHDRGIAIAKTIKQATADDIIVIAGKGHETTQEIAGVFHSYSDIEQVEKLTGRDTFEEAV